MFVLWGRFGGTRMTGVAGVTRVCGRVRGTQELGGVGRVHHDTGLLLGYYWVNTGSLCASCEAAGELLVGCSE